MPVPVKVQIVKEAVAGVLASGDGDVSHHRRVS